MPEQLSLGLTFTLNAPTCDHLWSPEGDIIVDGGPLRLRCSRCNGLAGRHWQHGPYIAVRCGLCCCLAFATSITRGVGHCAAHRLPAPRAAHLKACKRPRGYGAEAKEILKTRDVVTAPLMEVARAG